MSRRDSNINSNNDNSGVAPCRNWTYLGKCEFGDSCTYAHHSPNRSATGRSAHPSGHQSTTTTTARKPTPSSGASRRRKSSGGSSTAGSGSATARPKTVLTRKREGKDSAASPPPEYAKGTLSPLSRSAFPELPPSSSALEKAAKRIRSLRGSDKPMEPGSGSGSPPPPSRTSAKQPAPRAPCWGPPPTPLPPSTTGLASSVWGPPPGMPPPPPPPPGPPPAVPKMSSKSSQGAGAAVTGSSSSSSNNRNAAMVMGGDGTPQSAAQAMDSPQRATGGSPNRPPPLSSSTSSSGPPPFVLPSSAVGKGMRPPSGRVPRSPIPPIEKPAPLPPYMLERPPPHATSLSADPTIRKELQMHRVNTVLSNRDYPVDSNMPAVPDFVQNKYHTLLSLPEGGSNTRQAVITASAPAVEGQTKVGSSSSSSSSNVGNGSYFGYQYKTYFYKALSVADSYVYCLCRVDGFSLSNFDLVTEAVRTWSAIHHPCIVPLRQAFGTRDFIEAENPSQDGGSLVYVYDYIPSVATLQSVFIDSPTLKQNGIGGIPEHVIWDVLSQLIMCLKYIHSHGLSAKVIHPTKILVTDTAFLYPPRVYLNCVGLLDALAQESPPTRNGLAPPTAWVGSSRTTTGQAPQQQQQQQSSIAHQQQKDLICLGRLILSMATGRSDNALKIPEEMDASNGVGFMANPTYSDDLKSLAQILLTQVKDLSNYPTSEQLAFKYCNHIVNKFETSLFTTDMLLNEFKLEVDNSRMLKLLIKLCTIAYCYPMNYSGSLPSRAYQQSTASSSETAVLGRNANRGAQPNNGDAKRLERPSWAKNMNAQQMDERQLVNMFMEYLFGQVVPGTSPPASMVANNLQHVLDGLAKADVGTLHETITLGSKDGADCVLATFGDIKRSVDGSFRDLVLESTDAVQASAGLRAVSHTGHHGHHGHPHHHHQHTSSSSSSGLMRSTTGPPVMGGESGPTLMEGVGGGDGSTGSQPRSGTPQRMPR